MSFPIDPADVDWTPEGQELRMDRDRLLRHRLTLLAEQREAERLQYPYKFGS